MGLSYRSYRLYSVERGRSIRGERWIGYQYLRLECREADEEYRYQGASLYVLRLLDGLMTLTRAQNAHPGGVTGVVWEGPTKLATAGSDAAVRRWEIKHHA